jgi:hypothetical protein
VDSLLNNWIKKTRKIVKFFILEIKWKRSLFYVQFYKINKKILNLIKNDELNNIVPIWFYLNESNKKKRIYTIIKIKKYLYVKRKILLKTNLCANKNEKWN